MNCRPSVVGTSLRVDNAYTYTYMCLSILLQCTCMLWNGGILGMYILCTCLYILTIHWALWFAHTHVHLLYIVIASGRQGGKGVIVHSAHVRSTRNLLFTFARPTLQEA